MVGLREVGEAQQLAELTGMRKGLWGFVAPCGKSTHRAPIATLEAAQGQSLRHGLPLYKDSTGPPPLFLSSPDASRVNR